MNQCDVVLCNPVPTAIGTDGGSLKGMTAKDPGATAIRETLKRSGLANQLGDWMAASRFETGVVTPSIGDRRGLSWRWRASKTFHLSHDRTADPASGKQ